MSPAKNNRGRFKKALRRSARIALLFATVNAIGLSVFAAWWLRPLSAEWIRLRDTIALQERRVAIKEADFMRYGQYQQELAALAEAERALRLLEYSQISDAISGVHDLAAAHGLRENDFYADEPTMTEGFYRVRVSAFYAGTTEQILLFLEALDTLPCYISQITLTPSDGDVRVQLHLYAMAEEYE